MNIEDFSTKTINELAEIFDHIPKELYDKLPAGIINYVYQNSDLKNDDKSFVYNIALPITEQEIEQDTKDYIKMLARNYWK